MLDKYINLDYVNEICSNLVNSPKYFEKTDDVNNISLDKEYMLYFFYDAIYKYVAIIKDKDLYESYLKEVEFVIKKFDELDLIRRGISTIIGKYVSKIISSSDDKKIYEYIIDKYITNGYYVKGVNNLEFKKGYLDKSLYLDSVNKLYRVLLKYDIDILQDYGNYNTVSNSIIEECNYSAISPMPLYKLCEKNKISYIEKDYNTCKKNFIKLLNNTFILPKEQESAIKYFNDIWCYYNNNFDTNIYLVLVKRKLFNNSSELNYNDEFNLEENIYNIIYEKNNFIDIDKKIEEKLEFIQLKGYYSFVLKEEKEKKKIIDFNNIYNELELSNNYGKVSILLIFGTIFICLGVILSIILS